MPEPKKESFGSKSGKGGATGAAIGAARNAAKFLIQQGGTRAYNGLNIFDKTIRTAKGHPKWFARIDLPTVKTPNAHINVNKAITGVKDPHVSISTTTAQNASRAGTAMNYVNKAAPVLTAVAVAYDAYQIGCNVQEDHKNGTTRNTTKKMMTTAATWGGGYGRVGVGATIGTSFLPGIGTIVGGLVGGIIGGIGGNVASELAADAAMDAYKYDITYPECKICQEIFECRKFETGEQLFCQECTMNQEKISGSLSEKETCDDCGEKYEMSGNEKFCKKCKSEYCGWCRKLEESLEEMELEEGKVKICKECIDHLKREIENILKEKDKKWSCADCGTSLEGSECSGRNEDVILVLCKTCRDNRANEILQSRKKIYECR